MGGGEYCLHKMNILSCVFFRPVRKAISKIIWCSISVSIHGDKNGEGIVPEEWTRLIIVNKKFQIRNRTKTIKLSVVYYCYQTFLVSLEFWRIPNSQRRYVDQKIYFMEQCTWPIVNLSSSSLNIVRFDWKDWLKYP